jgi:phosphoribosylamine---glycine ligase
MLTSALLPLGRGYLCKRLNLRRILGVLFFASWLCSQSRDACMLYWHHMKVLVIGGGGREHALCWKLSQSSLVRKVYCAPGNSGTAQVAENVPIGALDTEALLLFVEQQSIDLTVVGPETPLIAGVVDAFEARGLRIFGPSKEPAQIEGSKVWAKNLMAHAGIPTSDFAVFNNANAARAYAKSHAYPLVIKADGEAAGKGVIIPKTYEEACEAITQIMEDRIFGASGDSIVIEECLTGPEASVLAFVDGETVRPMIAIQDHKRIGEGDTGPNTGGMGAYAPVDSCPPKMINTITERIIQPAVQAIRETGIPYRGCLYAGVMLTENGPYCIEFNCRFGDPECQIAMMLLESDLAEILLACIEARLHEVPVVFAEQAAMTVVMASGGYPGEFAKHIPIYGLKEAMQLEGVAVFHAGANLDEAGNVVTTGGRVLNVTAIGTTLQEARARAYAAVEKIHFEGAYVRKDIGWRALV